MLAFSVPGSAPGPHLPHRMGTLAELEAFREPLRDDNSEQIPSGSTRTVVLTGCSSVAAFGQAWRQRTLRKRRTAGKGLLSVGLPTRLVNSLRAETEEGSSSESSPHRPWDRKSAKFVTGLGIIISWQMLALNLFRWTKLVSPALKLKNLAGGYTTAGSLVYGLTGVLLVILRFQPGFLVKPRKYAWLVLVRAFMTRGCPIWYREHASQVISQALDSISTTFQVALASKLVLRALPLVMDLSALVIPIRAFFGFGEKFSMCAKTLAGIDRICSQFMANLVTVALSMVVLRMVLMLKNPPQSPEDAMPKKADEAMEGTSSIWFPMVGFIVWKRCAKQRSLRMRLQLFDKVLTSVAWVLASIPILHFLHLKVQTVLAVGGVGGLAVGLALKNLAQNLISGMLIFINSSVCESLEVELLDAKTSGIVSKVGWFNTRVNGYDGLQILVPNRTVLDGIVVDKSNKLFRKLDTHLLVTLDGHSSLSGVVDGVQALLESDETILQSSDIKKLKRRHDGNVKAYPPQCVFEGWSDLGASLRVRAFFPGTLSNDRFLNAKSKLLLNVDAKIAEKGGRVGYCNAPAEVQATALPWEVELSRS